MAECSWWLKLYYSKLETSALIPTKPIHNFNCQRCSDLTAKQTFKRKEIFLTNNTSLPSSWDKFQQMLYSVNYFKFCEQGKKVKVKAVCESYSTDALRHIVLLPEWVPSFISRGAAHTKRRERPLLAKEGIIPGI